MEDIEVDKILFYAVVKNVEIIGEAAYKLTPAYCNAHPATPWKYIAGMRHVLVHDYYQISVKELWKTVCEDIPPLQSQVADYLAKTNWQEWEKDEGAIFDSAAHKALMQTAKRMLAKGYDINSIVEVTGLKADEIER